MKASTLLTLSSSSPSTFSTPFQIHIPDAEGFEDELPPDLGPLNEGVQVGPPCGHVLHDEGFQVDLSPSVTQDSRRVFQWHFPRFSVAGCFPAPLRLTHCPPEPC
ncbi:hypothetical protein AMECASPLE_029346 [Ameca splendens]|uniref:Uncharacterized protein n=1 Tax=Ameca splendens TaxID=208324 RepID=A0ABV0ZGK4_9TELE